MKHISDYVKGAALCSAVWGLLLGALVHPIVGLACGILVFFAAIFFIVVTSGNHTHYGDGD